VHRKVTRPTDAASRQNKRSTAFSARSWIFRATTISSIVTPDDFASEPEAKVAAEKLIRKI